MSNRFLKRHLYPEPRLELGRWLAETRLATSMMDLSDGLSSDLPRLCTASGVGAQVESAKLPIVQLLKVDRNRGVDSMQLGLHGGDDYELLFTIKQADYEKIKLLMDISVIGHITELSAGCNLVTKSGVVHTLKAQGWNAFKS